MYFIIDQCMERAEDRGITISRIELTDAVHSGELPSEDFKEEGVLITLEHLEGWLHRRER